MDACTTATFNFVMHVHVWKLTATRLLELSWLYVIIKMIWKAFTEIIYTVSVNIFGSPGQYSLVLATL